MANAKLLVADQTARRTREATRGTRKYLKHIDLVAPANLHAQVAAGAALNVTTSWSAMPDPSRTVQIVVGTGGVACVFTVTGTRLGSVQTDTITGTGVGTFQGAKAFDSLTSVTSNVDPNGTVDIQTGSGFGLPEAFDGTLVRFSVDGADIGVFGSDAATGTVLVNPSSPPNASRDYGVTYNPAF